MKAIGNLLLVASVIFGALSAATSYLVPLDRPDEVFQQTVEGEKDYLVLAAPAGGQPTSPEQRAVLRERYEAGEISAEDMLRRIEARDPLVSAETPLTPETLATLRDAGVEEVRVKSFDFFRWPHWWVFLLSAAGLIIGSLMVRFADKAAVAAAGAKGQPGGIEGAPAQPEGPDVAFDEIRAGVESVRRAIREATDDDERLRVIVDRLGEAQRIHIPAFVEGRVSLVARLGLGGYAELMDRFARMERAVNRCWSAAADGVLPESLRQLEQIPGLLDETEMKLRAGAPANAT